MYSMHATPHVRARTSGATQQLSEIAPSLSFTGSMALTFAVSAALRHIWLQQITDNSDIKAFDQATLAAVAGCVAFVAYSAAIIGVKLARTSDQQALKRRSIQNAVLGLPPGILLGVMLQLANNSNDQIDAAAFTGFASIAIIGFCMCCAINCIRELPSETARGASPSTDTHLLAMSSEYGHQPVEDPTLAQLNGVL